jgi:hypothetical protein
MNPPIADDPETPSGKLAFMFHIRQLLTTMRHLGCAAALNHRGKEVKDRKGNHFCATACKAD